MLGKIIFERKPIEASLLEMPRTKYPVEIIGYNEDGDLIGAIDESKLSAVKRILLNAAMN